MEKTGFIYLWYDRKNRRYYLGSHLGAEDDGYVCSSRWMRQSYKRRPSDFKRRILKKNIPKQVLKEEEYKWLQLIKNYELGKRYYNLTIALNGNGWEKGKGRSEETKKKVSEGLKRTYQNGYEPWNKGKKQTKKVKQKVSEGLKTAWKEGRCNKNSSHFKKGQTPWNKGNSEHSKNIWKNNPYAGTSKKYLIVFPDGRKDEIMNLSKYCRENKLNKTQLHKYMSNKLKKRHKGIHIERILQ